MRAKQLRQRQRQKWLRQLQQRTHRCRRSGAKGAWHQASGTVPCRPVSLNFLWHQGNRQHNLRLVTHCCTGMPGWVASRQAGRQAGSSAGRQGEGPQVLQLRPLKVGGQGAGGLGIVSQIQGAQRAQRAWAHPDGGEGGA